jgi:hypothetical protein
LRERCEELEEENDEFKNRLQIRGELEKRVDAESKFNSKFMQKEIDNKMNRN